jgi:hypothetical protein
MQNNKLPAWASAAPVQPSSGVFDRVLGLARPPLIPGENEDQYNGLVARVVSGSKPRDAIEEILTRDIVDLTWEILRLRRLKARIFKTFVTPKEFASGDADKSRDDDNELFISRLVALAKRMQENGRMDKHGRIDDSKPGGISLAMYAASILSQLDYDVDDSIRKEMGGNNPAKSEVTRARTAAETSIEDLTAATLARNLNTFERIERMLDSVEARRNKSLLEIERHRAAYGASIRQTLDGVEDAEFQDVETGETTTGAQS